MRRAIVTGLYAQRIGHSGRNWNQPTDYSRSITLAEGLKRAGYHTMMVGKWQDPDLPARRGFDRFFGPMCAGKISYFHEVKLNPFYLDERRVELPDDFYLTDALTDHALDFLIAKEALARDDLAYVGMIGSKTKRATFAHWLEREGEPMSRLAKLILPIGGNSVRDKRPAIIAALVATELLQAFSAAEIRRSENRHGHPQGQDHA